MTATLYEAMSWMRGAIDCLGGVNGGLRGGGGACNGLWRGANVGGMPGN